MADYPHTTLYDTAAFGAAANTEFLLFKVPRGGDSTHIETFTNMRGSGQLPAGESFDVQRISATVDYAIPAADVTKWFVSSFLDFRINDRTEIQAPLAVFADQCAYGGADTTTAAANGNKVGLIGDGWDLGDKPLILPGGVSWYVRVVQGTALAGANSNIKIILWGTLHTAAA